MIIYTENVVTIVITFMSSTSVSSVTQWTPDLVRVRNVVCALCTTTNSSSIAGTQIIQAMHFNKAPPHAHLNAAVHVLSE